MARLIERKFDASRPLIVRRPFVANGRHYKPGDAFPWRTQSFSQRQAMLLHDAGKVAHPEDVPAKVFTPKAVKITPAPTIEQEIEDEDILAAAASPVSDVAEESLVGDATEEPETLPLDDLDLIDDMTELRRIADEVGAPRKVSKADQRAVIRTVRSMKES
jgi:hypothetical protein